MGITTILVTLCCIFFVKTSAVSVNTQSEVEPVKVLLPDYPQNSINKFENLSTSLEEDADNEQHEDHFVDSFTVDTPATEQIILETEKQAGEDQTINGNNDGRSAFINNQFVSDEQLSNVNSAPPLFEMIQKQMEQVLTESLYPPEAVKETYEQLISPTEIPTTVDENLDEQHTNTLENKENISETLSTYDPNTSPVVELPQPLAVMNTTASASSVSSGQSEEPAALDQKPTENPQFGTSNTTFSNNKRRVVFKTVSAQSHFFSTPLADFILKFSVGVGKPHRPEVFGKAGVQNFGVGNGRGYKGVIRNQLQEIKRKGAL